MTATRDYRTGRILTSPHPFKRALGLGGATPSWVDFEAGLAQFRDKLLPLMIDAGLRVAEPAPSEG